MGKTFRKFDKPKKKPLKSYSSSEDEDYGFGKSSRKGKFLPKYRKDKD